MPEVEGASFCLRTSQVVVCVGFVYVAGTAVALVFPLDKLICCRKTKARAASDHEFIITQGKAWFAWDGCEPL